MDRSEEFFSLAGISQRDTLDDGAPEFLRNAQNLVSQCESLERGVHSFISVVDSLDLLLCKSNVETDGGSASRGNDEQRQGRTYHELLRKISQIQQAIREVEESIDNSKDEMGPDSLVPFLPTRWHLIVVDPSAALQVVDESKGWTKSHQEGKHDQESGFTSADRRISPDRRVSPDRRATASQSSTRTDSMLSPKATNKPTEKNNENKMKLSNKQQQQQQQMPVEDEVAEDIKSNLVHEARHLLLEREVDRVDELHVKRMQQHLAELSMLDSFFATKVSEQQEICDNVVDLMEASVGQMADASKELSKAEKRGSSYRIFMITAYVTGAVILLIADLLTSRKRY